MVSDGSVCASRGASRAEIFILLRVFNVLRRFYGTASKHWWRLFDTMVVAEDSYRPPEAERQRAVKVEKPNKILLHSSRILLGFSSFSLILLGFPGFSLKPLLDFP